MLYRRKMILKKFPRIFSDREFTAWTREFFRLLSNRYQRASRLMGEFLLPEWIHSQSRIAKERDAPQKAGRTSEPQLRFLRRDSLRLFCRHVSTLSLSIGYRRDRSKQGKILIQINEINVHSTSVCKFARNFDYSATRN